MAENQRNLPQIGADLVQMGFVENDVDRVAQELGLNISPEVTGELKNAMRRASLASQFEDIPYFETDYELEDVLTQNENIVLRTAEANNELGGIVAPITQSDPDEATASLLSGDDTVIKEAEDITLSKATERAEEVIAQELRLSESPEQTLEILERGKVSLDKPINIGTLRENYIATKLNPEVSELDTISSRIQRDLVLASEVDKNINKVWEGSSFLDVIGDFGELIIPVSGVVEEEYIKYEQSIDSILDQVASAPVEDQARVLQAAIDTWMESETLLLGNNNSLLTVDRMESIREAILDGGLGLIEGTMSREQAEDAMFSALSGTIFAGELKAIGVGVKGLFKFLGNRIFPSKPSTEVAKIVKEGGLLDPEVAEAQRTNLLDFRKNSRVIDAEYTVRPENFISDKQNGLKELTESAGLKTEDATDRMTPNIEGNEFGFGNAYDEVTEMSDLVLMDESAVNAGMKRGRELEEVSGNSLKVVDSGSTIVRNEDPESLGDFVFTFGDSNKKGFKTKEAAEQAGKFGFKGLDFTTIKTNGQYFNKVTVKHQFDPRKDVTDLYADMRGTKFSGIKSVVLDPLRLLGKDVLDGVFALKGANRSKVTEQLNKFNQSVKSFGATKSEHLSKALKFGDDNGVEFTNKQAMADALGIPASKLSNRTFEAYQDLRKIMDDVYAVRNDNFRKLKQNQGYRFMDFEGDGHLAKPINKSEVTGDVMDASTKQRISLDEADGRILVRLDAPVTASDGSLFRTLAVLPDDLKQLPTQLLRKRTGHIDRFYRETGWTVKVSKTKNIDGVDTVVNNTTHILKNRDEALAARARLIEGGAPEDSVQIVRSRENDDLEKIYGDPDSVQFSYASTHTLKRGEAIKGSDGLQAPVLDPLESIQRSMYSLQREYDASMIQSLKARFINQFAPYLVNKQGTKWSTDLGQMIDGKSVSKEVIGTAKNWHDYIKGLQSLETSPVFRALDEAIEEIFPKVNSDTANISNMLQRLTSNLVILGRPLYQVPQNLFQATYIGIREPIHGSKAVAQSSFVVAHMLDDAMDVGLLAKVLGVDPATAEDFKKTLRSSGLWDSVGRADDFLAMAQNELTTGTSNWMKFYAKKYGAGTVRAPFEASKRLQETSIKYINLLAYLTEFNKQVVSSGKKYNAATKKLISARAQQLTQTQNGVNQFKYQNTGNWTSLMFQFMQHTHKLLLDVVLEPTLKAVTGKQLGVTASPFADTRKVAIATTAAVFTLFGFNGIFGENVGQYFSNKIRENTPDFAQNPVVKSYLDGGTINTFFNMALLSGEKGKVDVSGKINPASFIDSFYDFILAGGGSVDLLGASGSTIGSILDAGKAAKVILTNPVMDTKEKVYTTAFEIAELVKGFSDAERAFIAGNTGTWPYVSTLSGTMKVTEEEAIFAMFNVTPSMVADFYNNRASGDSKKKKTPDSTKIAKVFVKAMNRELALRKEQGTLNTILDTLEVIEKYSTMAKASVEPMAYSSVEDAFKRFGMALDQPTYTQYIKPYISKESIEDRRDGLVRLMQIAETPEAKAEIQAALELTDLIIEQTKQIYGDE